MTHIDLMPTLLELTGLPVPRQAQGTSHASLVSGTGTDPQPATRFSVTESWALPKPLLPPAVAIQDGSRKLIRYRRGAEVHHLLFDLEADPSESENIFAQSPELAAELMGELDEYLQRTQWLRRALGGQAENAPLELDARERGKLRALGYIE